MRVRRPTAATAAATATNPCPARLFTSPPPTRLAQEKANAITEGDEAASPKAKNKALGPGDAGDTRKRKACIVM